MKPKPPNGYFLLKDGDKMQAGDIYKAPGKKWVEMPNYWDGEIFGSKFFYPHARKSEKESSQ